MRLREWENVFCVEEFLGMGVRLSSENVMVLLVIIVYFVID